MSLRINPEELAELVAASHVVCPDILLDAVQRSRLDIAATATVAASEMLPAARVRLERWQETGIPSSDGIPELVEALERLGDRRVAIMDYHDASANFILLFSADLGQLLAAVRFHAPYPERPSDDIIATGEW